MERPKLSRDQAELTVEGVRRRWNWGGPWVPDPVPATPSSEEPPLGEPTGPADPEDSSQASASDGGAFRNSRDFVARPKTHEYTHVCRLCWPHRSQASEDDPSEGSLANSGDEQALPEAVPATSQSPALDPTLFTLPISLVSDFLHPRER